MSLIMETRTITLTRFSYFIKKLPKEYEKISSDISLDMAKDFGKSARGRSKGRLKSMVVRLTKKKNATVRYKDNETAKIARFVNMGAYPKVAIPAALMEYSRSGIPTAGRKARDVISDLKSLPKELRKFVHPKPSSSKGFLNGAWKHTLGNANKIINKRMEEAINKSL